ncbi:hypothetical protein C2S52_013152 [Perilla frutescens var. hirtella]|nr:hypothetical protein C2S52_013152 [Perilla frutescens var. hirtella]
MSDIWKALEVNFASQSKAKLMKYKLKLQTLKKDGREYDPMMVTITAQTDSWHLQDVYALFLDFEACLETARITSVNTEGSEPSACQISQASHSNNNNYNGRGREGYFNNNRGRNNNNRGNFRGRGHSRGGNNKLVCQVSGHTADRCWHRYDQSYGNQQQRHQQSPQHNYQNPVLNIAQYLSSSFVPPESNYNNTWYLDSGTTNHVSNDLSNLNTAVDYHGRNRL